MSGQKDKKLDAQNEQNSAAERRIEIFTGVVLLAFGIYQSILYFGYTMVPNSDFPDLFKVGKDLLSFKAPVRYKQAPVLGLLQNFLYPLAWGPSRELTAGWLLNAILHPLNLLLLWLVGKRIIGKAAVWIAIILIINPWTIYLLTEPIIETTFLFFILLSFYLIFRQSRWAYLAAATASMVRYEGAILILAAFLMDITHNKNKSERIRAVIYSMLASVPLGIWMLCTALSWRSGESHYLSLLFTKEYSHAFGEPIKNRTGILLNMKVLWYTAFAPFSALFYNENAKIMDVFDKMNQTIVVVAFMLGCIFSIFRRQWQVWMLFLFFIPYFLLHAFYPYPLSRFYATVIWIVMLVCCSGLLFLMLLVWGQANKLFGITKVFAKILWYAFSLVLIFWLLRQFPFFILHLPLSGLASISPRSASMPYVAMAVVGLIVAGRLYAEKSKMIPRAIFILFALPLIIISNQFTLIGVLGDGQREIEFRQLGEWFAANAKPGEKIAVYNRGPAQLFAGKYADNIVYYPKADNPRQLAEKLREDKVTYVTWTTREGTTKQHPDYQLLGLDKNIAFLSQPKNIGCYEFVRQIGSNRGFINVFRLKDHGEDQLPAQ